MKKPLLNLLFLLFTFLTTAQNTSISFENFSFEEIKLKAKKENKLIFLDAYTSWCGPCKWLSKNIFTNDTVATYFNKNYVNAKIDMEKGEGPELAKKYSVFCYPNLLFIDGDGKVVHRTAGAPRSAKEMIALSQNTLVDSENIQFFTSKYNENQNNPEFLKKYLNYLSSTCLPTDEIANTYFTSQTPSLLSSPENWSLIQSHVKSINSFAFKYLISNLNAFQSLYGTDIVSEKIIRTYSATTKKLLNSKSFNEDTFTKYLNSIKLSSNLLKDQIIFYTEIEHSLKKNELTQFGTHFIQGAEKHLLKQDYNSYSWMIFEKVSDQKTILKASELMKKICLGNDKISYAELDTYASLLFKLAKKQEALEIAEKALEIGRINGENIDETTELIKKIKGLK
jgi:thiol-disulfide isomerase/thioredoxin